MIPASCVTVVAAKYRTQPSPLPPASFKVGTTQSVIARVEDAEYADHSLTMLGRIAIACGVGLKLHAERKPNFNREVALV